MIALAFLLQGLYLDYPPVNRLGIMECQRASSRLSQFYANLTGVINRKEEGWGGNLPYQVAREIRFRAYLIHERTQNRIRSIAYRGDYPACQRIADEGRTELTERIIRPWFSR